MVTAGNVRARVVCFTFVRVRDDFGRLFFFVAALPESACSGGIWMGFGVEACANVLRRVCGWCVMGWSDVVV